MGYIYIYNPNVFNPWIFQAIHSFSAPKMDDVKTPKHQASAPRQDPWFSSNHIFCSAKLKLRNIHHLTTTEFQQGQQTNPNI